MATTPPKTRPKKKRTKQTSTPPAAPRFMDRMVVKGKTKPTIKRVGRTRKETAR